MHPTRIFAFSGSLVCATTVAAWAAATQVNIADPDKANRAAAVEIGNRLAVQEVAPSSFYHSSNSGIVGCVRIAAPPNGKALIVRQVRITTFSVGETDTAAVLYANSTCADDGVVASVALTGPGLTPVTFDPGVAIPMGYGFSFGLVNGGGSDVDVFVDGYVVPANAAPVAGQIIESAGRRRPRL
jgi:hypothetical protein